MFSHNHHFVLRDYLAFYFLYWFPQGHKHIPFWSLLFYINFF
uniref:Uncharacterized protein n=1 Tax=Arundo donax TaxID=35708 RepID=A0A0A8YXJ3_ARUDO